MFVVVPVVSEFVLYGVVIDIVVVTGGRFLGSGRVGVWEDRLVWRFVAEMYYWGRG